MFCTIKFVYYKSFCVRDDIGSYIRTVYHMVSHTPKPEVPGSSPGRRARTSEGANTVPFPPHGENCTMLAPSSFSESNPLRWASIRVFKVISRRRRRPIDRWCCFSFPNRTHFIGLRFGSHQGANTVPFPLHGENCTNVGSFFLFRIEPTPLGFDLLFLQQGGQAQFVPARLRIFFRFPIFTF